MEDITSVIGDGLHGTPQYNPNGAYYFVNGNNLSNRQIIIKNNTKRVSEEEYIKYKKPLNEHTILVSINGTIGNIGTYSNEQIILGKSACYFNITPFLVKEYMCYVIESNYFQKYALLSATGSTIKNVPLKAINEFYVPIPPVSEQKRIVSEIDYLLAFINKVEEGRENLQNIVQSAKSKILDLAIHGKLVPQDPNEEPASELLKRINPKAEITCDTPQYGKLPKGWCSCTLRNVCSFTNGFAFSSDAYKNNGIPLVRISNITNEGKIDLNSCVYIQDEIDEQYIIEKGDFLVAMSGATTGKMGVYTYGEISYLNQRVGKIKASKALYTPYMHYLMYSQVDNILKMAYGGAQPNISAKAILAIRILLPPLAEQQRIVAKIEDLFTQLDKIEASL